jgi:nitroreductase
MDDSLPATGDPHEIEDRLAMPLAEAMLTQRSVRRVHPGPVDDRTVLRCLELALQAPTASNAQNWEFVVVKDRAVKAALAAQYRRIWAVYATLGRWAGRAARDDLAERTTRSVKWQVEHFEQIPVLVVCCLRGGPWLPWLPKPRLVASSHYGSVYPSAQNLLLAARSVGLGGALITLPLWSTTVARRVLKLPLNIEPCCIVALGWPKGRYGPKARRPVGSVAHLDHYGNRPWGDQT